MKQNPHYLTSSLVCYYFATCASLIFLIDNLGEIDIQHKNTAMDYEEVDIWAVDFKLEETTKSLKDIFIHWTNVRATWRCLGIFILLQIFCNSISFILISFCPRKNIKTKKNKNVNSSVVHASSSSSSTWNFCLNWNFLFSSLTAIVNFSTLIFYSTIITSTKVY